MSGRHAPGERLYRALLTLYPAEYRRRFGDEMMQLFRDRLRDTSAGGRPGGTAVTWFGLIADVIRTAPGEHLRRNRIVAHSLAAGPSLATRLLGLAGVAAGLAILAAFVIDLPSGVFRDRLIVFAVGVSAIAIGVHLRQADRAPVLSLGVTAAFVAANLAFAVSVVLLAPGHIVAFWTGAALWLTGAAVGLTSALLGSVSRIGAWAVALGSLLTLTGIDRLRLTSEALPTIFNTLSQVGIVGMALGWIVLGLDVALRPRATAVRPGRPLAEG